MIEKFNRLLEDLRNRTRLMIARGIIKIVQNAAIETAQFQMLADEVQDNVEILQQYGFCSVPIAGAEGVAVFMGGMRDHGVIIATEDRRYRLKTLLGGEVALYTDEGDSVILKRGKLIEFNTNTLTINAATKVNINTPLVEASGIIYAKGEVRSDNNIRDFYSVAGGKTMAGMRSIFQIHTHNETGTVTNTPNQTM